MFTKATIVEWDPTSASDVFYTVDAKGMELKNLGKTDNFQVKIAPDTYKRLWIDQAAAEEWIAFVTTVSADYSVPLIRAEIIDNV